jgi:hypothetical protein
MKRFTDAGRQAIKDGNLYAGLSLALTLPDVCSSLEDPGPGKSQKRYEQWCKQWLEPKFTLGNNPLTGNPMVFIRAEDIFQLRCSLIHSGTAEIDLPKRTGVDRFLFFDQTTAAHLTKFEKCSFNGVEANLIQLSADHFSQEIFTTVDEWDVAVTPNQQVQVEKSKLLFIHSKGAVIHGIRFG